MIFWSVLFCIKYTFALWIIVFENSRLRCLMVNLGWLIRSTWERNTSRNYKRRAVAQHAKMIGLQFNIWKISRFCTIHNSFECFFFWLYRFLNYYLQFAETSEISTDVGENKEGTRFVLRIEQDCLWRKYKRQRLHAKRIEKDNGKS